MKTFSKGIHPDDRKNATKDKPIKEAALPKKVILPLQQNLGCPNDSLVKVGDQVVEGQKIADSEKFVSAPIHASISGKVTAIEKLPNPCDFDVPSIVIEAGEQKAIFSEQKIEHKHIENLNPAEIRKIVREAGIVGLGGAAFPTHVKLSPPAEKKIDTIIVNGCECEPYITADHRLMLEKTADILFGAKAIARAAGASKVIVGIEANKKDAAEKMKNESRMKGILGIEVALLKNKYPQGGEKMLVKALLNREVPSGGLPMDVGVIVHNVGTCVAVAEAIKFNRPLVRRVVTVTGSGVVNPSNLMLRIGTTFEEAVKHCGGLTEDAAKIVMGGPLTGIAVASLDLPVVKATTCILVLNKADAKVYEEVDCIRCGRCIKACPINLLPNFIADYAKLKDWDRAEELNVADCIECGACAYVCPARIFLVQYFKVAKNEQL